MQATADLLMSMMLHPSSLGGLRPPTEPGWILTEHSARDELYARNDLLRLFFEHQCVRVREPDSSCQDSSFWNNQRMVKRLCREHRKNLLPTRDKFVVRGLASMQRPWVVPLISAATWAITKMHVMNSSLLFRMSIISQTAITVLKAMGYGD